MSRVLWIIVTAVLAIVSLFVGVEDVPIDDFLHLTSEQKDVLLISRVPRTISIIIAGAGMSLCGLIMQQITHNRFVSPTTAGTMDAARLGVLVALMVFPAAGTLSKMLVAFVFALAGTFLFIAILQRIRIKDPIFIPLVGLMFGNILGSITTFFAYKNNLVQNIGTWLQGDFSSILRGRYELLYLSIPLFIIAWLYADRFTAAGLGESFATNIGLNYRATVTVGLSIAALMTATVLLTVGAIPFLGLIVPNIVSIYAGDHLRRVIPLTVLFGASFVLICDIAGRLIIYPYEISISLMVGIIGSILFICLLVRRQKDAPDQ
ncbi:ABC transporter permease [Sporolactobacillus sp. THM19-2]|uniref:ABC transporter permease n=1 Tax=Sporolactobacillus sp. THM19-2 TaxID=2511171 RepID=UPI0010221320|nr:ABC transporter permease [Sporolactobacillus sp. THM19-2]RYL94046.1 ABC transporter permease [Sporolactobacillus sp. THM19-2]